MTMHLPDNVQHSPLAHLERYPIMAKDPKICSKLEVGMPSLISEMLPRCDRGVHAI